MKQRRKKKQAPAALPIALVENPNWSRAHDGDKTNPRLVSVVINPRESAIGTMYARRLLDETQTVAASRFRGLWEALGGKGASAIDYSREPVDGGKIADPISIRQMQAGRELKQCRELLGARGYDLVCKVAGEGYQVSELYSEKRAQLSAMDHLRGLLDDLAGMWGYSNSAHQKRVAVQK